MSAPIVKSPSSETDFAGLVEYFAAIDESLAGRFMKAVDATLDRIAMFPDMGSPWESQRKRLRDVRFSLVDGFENYLITYRHVRGSVFVLRILDARRDLENIL
jgi:plasmid stabilization system protein ParE